jgi:hypothetical protein
MAETITSVQVAENLTALWGINAYEYRIDTDQIDFQDLMIAVSEKRAVAVEAEVQPLTTRIRSRNAWLDELGQALSDLTRLQAAFKSDDAGDAQRETMNDNTYNTIYKLQGTYPTKKEYKQWVEYYIQLVKTEIDGENNRSQTDMSRLQSLVDRRDESYSTATNLMTSISDTRSNLIRNL